MSVPCEPTELVKQANYILSQETETASHSSCLFTLFSSATPVWPWMAVSSSPGSECIWLRNCYLSVSCWVSHVQPSSLPWDGETLLHQWMKGMQIELWALRSSSAHNTSWEFGDSSCNVNLGFHLVSVSKVYNLYLYSRKVIPPPPFCFSLLRVKDQIYTHPHHLSRECVFSSYHGLGVGWRSALLRFLSLC